MRRHPRLIAFIAAPLLLAGLAAPALAADASIDQVYAEAKSGNVEGALGMMQQVLKDHPNSAKAHYIEAELLARAHRAADASGELAKAEAIAPGLPFATPRAVGQLKATIAKGGAPVTASAGVAQPVGQPAAPAEQGGGIPWAVIIIVGLVIFGMLALMRRRSTPVYGGPMGGAGYGGGAPGYPPAGGYGGGFGPGYGAPMGGMGGGGLGSGIVGGLASGAAMGAGFAAGEEVIDHMFGGGRERDRGFDNGGGGWAGGGGGGQPDPNADMGGNDFGISDAGSWDSGGGDSGGDTSGGW